MLDLLFNEESKKYMKYIYPIIMLILINSVMPLLFNAMGIELSYVINYFVLLNLILIFYYILPDKVGSMFE